jgi:hypothetical protein
VRGRAIGRITQAVCACALLASGAAFGQVVINEIAWGGTAASATDEWIELHNSTTEAIDLTGWTLRIDEGVVHLGSVEDGTLGIRNSVVEPGGYLLLERTDDTTVSDIEADVLYKGGLSNGGADVVLVDAWGETVDQALFAEAGWPAGAGSDGEPAYATMERAESPDTGAHWATCRPTFAANGFDASAGPIAGTPGAGNSVVLFLAHAPQLRLTVPPEGAVLGTVMIEWSAIDPDGDDARLRITISLWEDGDRVVLAENLANTGSFAWDTTGVANGEYRLEVSAEDGDGHIGPASVDLEVDNEAD